MLEIYNTTRLVRTENILFGKVDDELVVLNIDKGKYYNLNETSTDIWESLKNPSSFNELIDYLLNKYSVNRDICLRDTKEILKELIDIGLVKIQ